MFREPIVREYGRRGRHGRWIEWASVPCLRTSLSKCGNVRHGRWIEWASVSLLLAIFSLPALGYARGGLRSVKEAEQASLGSGLFGNPLGPEAASIIFPEDRFVAEHEITFRGQVLSKADNHKIAGARIVLRPQGDGTEYRLFERRSDKEGRFVFEKMPPGSYRIEIHHPQEGDTSQRIELYDGNVERTFYLENAALPLAAVVSVVDRADASDASLAFSNLTRNDLEERASVRDIPVLISELPSTTFYSENGNGIGYNYLRIRGVDQRRISVMIDGVPQNDPEDHNVYWINFFDLAGSLEDVQVQRGAGAGFYGPPAIGGSINLVTRTLSDKPFTNIELGYGSFQTARATLEVNSGLLKDRWVVYGRFSHLRSEGYRDWSWTRFYRGFLGGAWYGSRSSLKLQIYGGPQYDALAYYGIPLAYNEDDDLRRTNYGAPADGRTGDIEFFNQIHADLLHSIEIKDGLNFNQTLFFLSGAGYFDFDASWGDPLYFQLCTFDAEGNVIGDYPEYCESEDGEPASIPADTMMRAFVDNKQIGWLPRLSWDHGENATLILGLEARMHRSLHWGRIQAGSDYPEEVVGEADRHFYEFRGSKDILSPYLHESYRAGRLGIDATVQSVFQRYRIYEEMPLLGGGGENDFTAPYLFVNPKVGLSYRTSDQVLLFASAAQTSREPRLKELYDGETAAWGATPDLEAVRPERARDLELGLRVRTAPFLGSMNFFYLDIRDEIVPTGGLDLYGQPYYGNADRVLHMGVELEGALRLHPSLTLSGNLSISRNRFISFGEYTSVVDPSTGESVTVEAVRDGNPVAASPDIMGAARLTWRKGGTMATLGVRAVDDQFADNAGWRPDKAYADDGTEYLISPSHNLVDAYALVDASLLYTFPETSFLRHVRVGLDFFNVTDERVLLSAQGADNYFPAAPRSFFARLSYRR